MKNNKYLTKIGFALIAIGIIALIMQSCSQTLATDAPNDDNAKGIPATITKVAFEKIALPIRISGHINASKESRLSFKTGGIIKKVYVDAGDNVKANDVLAQLDLKEINQQVKQARVGLEKAKRDYKRVENLYNDTVTTLEQLQNAASALEVAQATLNIAEYNLKFSTITAPSDGIILRKFMEESEITGPGTPVFYFATAEESWKMEVGISDKDVVKFRINDEAEIETDAYPGQKLQAYISKIASAPDLTTGLYQVELSITNKGLSLKPGFFARGEIYPSQKIDCCKFPVDAVQEGWGTTVSFFLYDEKSGKANRTESEVLFLHDNYVYVKAEVFAQSNMVITQKQKELKNLDKIQLADIN